MNYLIGFTLLIISLASFALSIDETLGDKDPPKNPKVLRRVYVCIGIWCLCLTFGLFYA